MKKSIAIGIGIGCYFFLAICAVCLSMGWWLTTQNAKQAKVQPTPVPCPSLPDTFQKPDLNGTWIANYDGLATDTLILREDGMYKQIYDSPQGRSLHFESDWQVWWIKHRPSGFLRLHMKGMRRYDDVSSLWDREGGEIPPGEITAVDYCEHQVIEMSDEIVLVVTGNSTNYPNVPRGIWLR